MLDSAPDPPDPPPAAEPLLAGFFEAFALELARAAEWRPKELPLP